MSDGNDRLVVPTTTHHAAIACGQRAVLLAGRRRGGFGERGPQPAIAFARRAGAAFARALVVARTQSRPARQMPRGRKYGHVRSDLGDQHLGHALAHARDRIEALDLLGIRRHHFVDPKTHLFDGLLEVVDVPEELAHNKRVMGSESAAECFAQGGQLGPQPPPGEVRQRVGVPRAADQRGKHRAGGDPEDMAGHGHQLDPGVLQHLVEAARRARALIGLAHERGIPPHFLKAQVRQEAGPSFDPEAYRYEPLSVDLASISAGLDQRIKAPYSLYRLATADGLIQGSDIVFADITPRSIYSIIRGRVLRPIAPSDTLVSALEIYQNNDAVNRWSTFSPARARLVSKDPTLLAFTAQTPLAASYGLLQILYRTAIDVMNWPGVDGHRNPSLLFDTSANQTAGGGSLTLASGYLRRIYSRANPSVSVTMPAFDSPNSFASAFEKAFNFYNHASITGAYGASVLRFVPRYAPVPSSTIFSTQ